MFTTNNNNNNNAACVPASPPSPALSLSPSLPLCSLVPVPWGPVLTLVTPLACGSCVLARVPCGPSCAGQRRSSATLTAPGRGPARTGRARRGRGPWEASRLERCGPWGIPLFRHCCTVLSFTAPFILKATHALVVSTVQYCTVLCFSFQGSDSEPCLRHLAAPPDCFKFPPGPCPATLVVRRSTTPALRASTSATAGYTLP